jgi:hypothetical protein
MFSVNIYSLDYGLITGFNVGYNIIDRSYIGDPDKGLYINNDYKLSASCEIGYRIDDFRIIHAMTFDSLLFDKILSKSTIEYNFNNFTLKGIYFCKEENINDIDIYNESLISISFGYRKEF